MTVAWGLYGVLRRWCSKTNTPELNAYFRIRKTSARSSKVFANVYTHGLGRSTRIFVTNFRRTIRARRCVTYTFAYKRVYRIRFIVSSSWIFKTHCATYSFWVTINYFFFFFSNRYPIHCVCRPTIYWLHLFAVRKRNLYGFSFPTPLSSDSCTESIALKLSFAPSLRPFAFFDRLGEYRIASVLKDPYGSRVQRANFKDATRANTNVLYWPRENIINARYFAHCGDLKRWGGSFRCLADKLYYA